jgi:hypothetical protein
VDLLTRHGGSLRNEMATERHRGGGRSRFARLLGIAIATTGLAGALLATPAAADSTTGMVVDDDHAQCPKAEFETIQKAVDQAAKLNSDKTKDGELRPNNDVHLISVCPGVYEEQVAVDTSLTISGVDETVSAVDCFSPTRPTFDPTVHVIVAPRVDAPSGVPTVLFDLQADNIELEGLILHGNDNAGLDSNPIQAAVQTSAAHSGYEISHNFFVANTVATFLRSNGENPSSFHDNCLRESGWGVANQFLALSDARVHHNSSFRTRNFTYEQSACGSCAGSIGMAEVTFDHNVSQTDDNAFRLARSVNTSVLQNDVRATRRGILLFGNNQGLRIVGNLVNVAAVNVRGPGLAGIAQGSSQGVNDGVLIQGNTITGPAQNSGIGMGAGALTNSVILDNVISDVNGPGIAFLSGNTLNLVSGNIVLRSGTDGIQVAAGATVNTFELNQIHGSGRIAITGVDARDNNAVWPSNAWSANDCETDNQSGAICGVE